MESRNRRMSKKMEKGSKIRKLSVQITYEGKTERERVDLKDKIELKTNQ